MVVISLQLGCYYNRGRDYESPKTVVISLQLGCYYNLLEQDTRSLVVISLQLGCYYNIYGYSDGGYEL